MVVLIWMKKLILKLQKMSMSLSTEDEVPVLATAYTPLRFIMDWYGYFDLQEESGDVIGHTHPSERLG